MRNSSCSLLRFGEWTVGTFEKNHSGFLHCKVDGHENKDFPISIDQIGLLDEHEYFRNHPEKSCKDSSHVLFIELSTKSALILTGKESKEFQMDLIQNLL
mgnify:FL=1